MTTIFEKGQHLKGWRRFEKSGKSRKQLLAIFFLQKHQNAKILVGHSWNIFSIKVSFNKFSIKKIHF